MPEQERIGDDQCVTCKGILGRTAQVGSALGLLVEIYTTGDVKFDRRHARLADHR